MKRRLLVVVMISCLSVAACGGDDDDSGSAGGENKPFDCALITPAMIKDQLGLDAQAPTSEQKAGGTVCTFLGADSKLATRVELTRSPDSAAFDAVRKTFESSYGEVKKEKGLGGDAYSIHVEAYSNKTNTLALRKGDLEVVINSTADGDKVRSLMETLLDEL